MVQAATGTPPDKSGEDVSQQAIDPLQQTKDPTRDPNRSPSREDTIIIDRDFSVAVKDAEGNVIDRYNATDPKDILRWLLAKRYTAATHFMVGKTVVTANPGKPVSEQTRVDPIVEIFGKTVIVRKPLTADEAALLNLGVNAKQVRRVKEGVVFVFASKKHLAVHRGLLEQIISTM
jgi:hypothetical protein